MSCHLLIYFISMTFSWFQWLFLTCWRYCPWSPFSANCGKAMWRNCSRIIGGRLDEVLSMVSYKSRRAEDANVNTYSFYRHQYVFNTCHRIHSIHSFMCLIPAVIYCDGAFAPDDRRAPEYLEAENSYKWEQSHKTQWGNRKFVSERPKRISSSIF